MNTIKKSFTNKYQDWYPCLSNKVNEDCDHKLQNLKLTANKTIFESSFLEQVKIEKEVTYILQ